MAWIPPSGKKILHSYEQDAKDLIAKWLPIPIDQYFDFDAGCPPQDYTQDKSLFIKSYQFEEDVA